ncbi:MarR family transcriptional regulator [Flavivirga abyssicola]|uniref:MarR family winged helix-turn-helix transcriptional regulator n=1 Tax=Flavivirga abyssicola TaxID=3063533 RepID=UPI0026DF73F5|nr:MarR family transcriptional regulator [Flavivirga sp. MEBiC07777]WVK14371.1 MarR family transcriptional regulator [Flavivirga sp. MEBiC07777]
MTDKAFAATGISASYGHLILILAERPGLSQNDLSKLINVKASTMTRFIDKLEQQDLVERKHEGRTTSVFLTENGEKMKPVIMSALRSLYEDYCEVFGKEFAEKLTADIHSANMKIME